MWLAAIAREYRDAIRFTKPPATLQAAIFEPLAAIARRTGRDPDRSSPSMPVGATADWRLATRFSGFRAELQADLAAELHGLPRRRL